MEEYMKLAANYGFPMVVAGYLLVRLEPLIKELQKSITLLTLVVARQSDIDVDKMRQIVDGGS
ncbi:YvrJ family protein [Desulfallas thermosapovorans]|uniref:YvrJ-like protein n=1 Tax=Desulfallas thermosapovorans DSM 6562 TaxID=1121431 RepID=A0A5S4ZMR8_9FIRM|nr:YvrJ family protein [Desulfallas thermosapovorans]TYO92798.1 YvrJ-like protein [Desulfallas thermosapovorans DSM 6562]